MSVKLRLRRMGRRKRPIYALVATDSRNPRDGRFIEDLGRYRPLDEPARVVLKDDRVLYWLQQGAQPSDTVRNLLSRHGLLLAHSLTLKGKSDAEIEQAVEAHRSAVAAKQTGVATTPKARREEALKAERERVAKAEEQERKERAEAEAKAKAEAEEAKRKAAEERARAAEAARAEQEAANAEQVAEDAEQDASTEPAAAAVAATASEPAEGDDAAAETDETPAAEAEATESAEETEASEEEKEG